VPVSDGFYAASACAFFSRRFAVSTRSAVETGKTTFAEAISWDRRRLVCLELFSEPTTQEACGTPAHPEGVVPDKTWGLPRLFLHLNL